ncbi:MAG: replicative DNA helicase [Lachnospiraceae bacterium]|nr:replicative DNA helicase [Lachnospiraceae bacterium]MBQ7832818.1 replicative DNA helicase [Lachnospiraceae bacterium]
MDEAVVKRVLPHSTEAEQSVLGAMIMDADAITTASEVITGDDFYNKQYGIIFDTIVELNNGGSPVDLVTLQNKLKEKNVPPEVSSMEYVKDFISSIYTSANVKNHAEIVQKNSVLRKLIRTTEKITDSCYFPKDDVEVILEETERKVFEIVQKRNTKDFVPIQQVVMNALDRIEKAAKQKGEITGVTTGFTDLDYATAGLQPSDLVLVAARPSMGKTAFALNIALNAALKGQKTVAIFSLEMSKEQLVNRLFAMESKVNSQNLRTGKLSDKEWDQLMEGAIAVGKSKLVIDDTGSISVSELRSKCRKYKLEHGLDMIMIDYLQLMTGSGKTDSRQQEVSEISRSLKALARELNVPVVALSQLSRKVEERPDKRPMMSDLRESGAIEQDADVIMFIYRDDYYTKEKCERPGVAEIIIAKQRNGPVGTVELAWLADYTQFKNLAK